MTALRPWLIGVGAFVRKDLVEILHQPRLVVILVAGPFLILGLFGAGLRATDPPIRYVIVEPETEPVRAVAEQFVAQGQEPLVFTRFVENEEIARRLVRAQDVDLAIAFSGDVAQRVISGDRSDLVVYHDFADPLETRVLEIATQRAADTINEFLAQGAVAEVQGRVARLDSRVREARIRLDSVEEMVGAGDAAAAEPEIEVLNDDLDTIVAGLRNVEQSLDDRGLAADATILQGVDEVEALLDEGGDDGGPQDTAEDVAALRRAYDSLDQITTALSAFIDVPPAVIVSPIRGVTRSVGNGSTDLTSFYAPAVVVLLVQHMVVTMVSLSVVRDRQLGTTQLLGIAPLRESQLLIGKYAAYGIVGLAVCAAVIPAMVVGLGVPLLGSPVALALSALGVVAASTALGFLIAMFAGSDSQAIQYSMLLLLASIFFSGMIISADRFIEPLQAASSVLPATFGMTMFRDVMLRGQTPEWAAGVALLVMFVVATVANVVLLHRRSRPM